MAARPALRLAALLLLRGQARGIVRRDDVDPQLYATTPAAYQGAVLMLNPDGDAPGKPGSRRFNVECAATMISREHLVTAAHCLCDDDASSAADGARLRTTPDLWVEKQHYPVTVAGEKHTVVASYLNPDCHFRCNKDGPNRCDVAVLKLARPVVTSAMTPYPVYNRSDEVGKRVQMVGWGVTGTANNISKRDCNNGPEDGVFRHAENVVTAANGVIEYKMDSPPQALPLEGICQRGQRRPALPHGQSQRHFHRRSQLGLGRQEWLPLRLHGPVQPAVGAVRLHPAHRRRRPRPRLQHHAAEALRQGAQRGRLRLRAVLRPEPARAAEGGLRQREDLRVVRRCPAAAAAAAAAAAPVSNAPLCTVHIVSMRMQTYIISLHKQPAPEPSITVPWA